MKENSEGGYPRYLNAPSSTEGPFYRNIHTGNGPKAEEKAPTWTGIRRERKSEKENGERVKGAVRSQKLLN